MENQTHSANTDIAEQTYKGTGVTISAIGYSWVDFKISAVAAGAVGLAMSWLAPKGTEQSLRELEERFTRWGKASGIGYQAMGKTGTEFIKMGKWFEDHVPFRKGLKNIVGEAKWTPVSRLTGMLTVVGFGASFITGFFRAKSSASGGKHQFEAAQAEIKTLRKQLAESQQEANKKEHALTPTDQTAESATHTKVMQQPDVNDTPRSEVQAQSAMREPLQQPEAATSKTL